MVRYSKKYQLTINNPEEKGWTHEKIKAELAKLKSVVYYCLCDEIGLETKTPHTHIFLYAKNTIRFDTIKNHFPQAHIESAKGSVQQNRQYILKEGPWSDSNKSESSMKNTFEEWGTPPVDLGQGFRSDMQRLLELILEGHSNAEILLACPDLALHIGKIDKIRQDILQEEYKNCSRPLEVIYIWGPTGVGKTRGMYEAEGGDYSSVYRVTDYQHPFDLYLSQPVICFDEFRSSLRVQDILQYLDIYPLVLPARYTQRQACYTTAYLISNIDLTAQYPDIQRFEPETWKAFLRRIHKVIQYHSDGHRVEYTIQEYLHGFVEVDTATTGPLPFEEATKQPLGGNSK